MDMDMDWGLWSGAAEGGLLTLSSSHPPFFSPFFLKRVCGDCSFVTIVFVSGRFQAGL